MVTEAQPDTLEEIEEPEGFDPEASEVVEESQVEEEPNPLAELEERLGKIEQNVQRFNDLDPGALKSALGRLSQMQSSLDKMQGAKEDPRVSVLQEQLDDVANLLLESDLVDDGRKQSFQSKRTQKQSEAQMRALEEQIQQLKQPQQAQQGLPPEWQAAQDFIKRRESAMNMAVPPEVWLAGQRTGTPATAMDHILRWMEENAGEEPVEPVAAKKRAASSSPKRSGGSLSNEDIIERYGQQDPDITLEQYQKAAKALGYQ